MKCYNHPDRDSVAICPACGRALCHECARETGAGISCSEQCTEALREKETLFAEFAVHLKNTRRASLLSGLFSLGMGALFIYFSGLGAGFIYDFVLLLGIGFTIYGILALLATMFIFLKKEKHELPDIPE